MGLTEERMMGMGRDGVWELYTDATGHDVFHWCAPIDNVWVESQVLPGPAGESFVFFNTAHRVQEAYIRF